MSEFSVNSTSLQLIRQLELEIEREYQPDRNRSKGGRSFYFFDLDDNVFMLPTPMLLFKKGTSEYLKMSTGEFAQFAARLGSDPMLSDYEIRYDDATGSYQKFRDHINLPIHEQPFVKDLKRALIQPESNWKGPSWNGFYHAVFNQRPMAVITARGHHPQTIRAGLDHLTQEGFLPPLASDLTIYPVSHPETKGLLGDKEKKLSVPELKKRAIRHAVEQSMSRYGNNPFHRFGMSDDDPKNIQLILEAMKDLKVVYPKNSFYVFSTAKGRVSKIEIPHPKTRAEKISSDFNQMSFL